MKRVLSVALLATLVTTSAFAKPSDHGQGNPPVGNPGKDIIISLPDTPAPINTNFHSPVSNVPEPESVAMMIAGVAVVGAVAWRRRNRK